MLTVRTNMPAMIAYRNYGIHQKNAAKALQRLSSGYRINSAADDAAGLAISERMRGQIRGLRMASRNAQNAISMLQTAEGGLNETHSILQRMRELAVQASNGTWSEEDRKLQQLEYEQLMEEISRISNSTHYNGIKLLNGTSGGKKGNDAFTELGLSGASALTVSTGSYDGALKLVALRDDTAQLRLILQTYDGKNVEASAPSSGNVTFTMEDGTELILNIGTPANIKEGVIDNIRITGMTVDESKAVGGTADNKTVYQIGANGSADQRLGIFVRDMSAASLGNLSTGLLLFETDITTRENANLALEALTQSINQVSSERAKIGATVNRLEHTINNLESTAENLTAAESIIRDADMAAEMMNFVKSNLLMQAAQAMMAQAAQMPNIILQMINAM